MNAGKCRNKTNAEINKPAMYAAGRPRRSGTGARSEDNQEDNQEDKQGRTMPGGNGAFIGAFIGTRSF